MNPPTGTRTVAPARSAAETGDVGPHPPGADGWPSPASAAICPYLLAPGRWRAIEPSRHHECTAVNPPAPLTLEKQRRLCLEAAHAECATYLAAVDARAALEGPVTRRHRPIARTAPLLLDRARPMIALPESFDSRRVGQLGLIGALVVAVLAVVVAGLPGGSAPGAQRTSPPATTPGASVAAAVTPSASPQPTPGPTPHASSTPRPTPVPTPVASSSAVAAGTQTYRVKAGDTLIGIAARFRTTVQAIQQLNGIKDPRLIRIGQVLRLP